MLIRETGDLNLNFGEFLCSTPRLHWNEVRKM